MLLAYLSYLKLVNVVILYSLNLNHFFDSTVVIKNQKSEGQNFGQPTVLVRFDDNWICPVNQFYLKKNLPQHSEY